MTSAQNDTTTEKQVFPAKVVHVQDEYTVAINRGYIHDIKKEQKFLVYGLSKDDIIDPDTKENLGKLEIVRGIGKVTHVQPKVSTITSSERYPGARRIIKTRSPIYTFQKSEEIVNEPGHLMEFEDAQVGDLAKPI